jgi:very-short-patch-repair endonuclease
MSWRDVARLQGGVVTAEQLAAAGISRDAACRMLVGGELVRLTRGVYLAGGAPLSYRARLWAAVLATGGVLSRATAGRLWGVCDDDDVIHVALRHSRRVAIPAGVRLHRQVIPPAEIRHRCGLPTMSRTVAILDMLATSPYWEASRLADRAQQKGWLVPGDCERRLRTQPGRPGNRQLRRLLATMGDGAAAESERTLHRLLRRASIAGWRPNYEVWSAGDLVAVVDVAFPDRRLAIEVDGMAYHVDVDRFRGDRRRQNRLVALGWTVLRFTWADLIERPSYVIATIRTVLRESGSVSRAGRG